MIFLGPTILQFPDAAADRATFQVIVRLPELSPREEMAVRAVSELLMESTGEYSKPQIMRYGSQTGINPSIEMMPGFIRLSFSTPSNQVPLGISLIDSILRRPLFPEQTLNEWKLKNQTLSTNYWQVALWPQTPKVSDLRKTDLRDAFIRYFRPENTFIALGGNFPVEIPDKLQARFSDWIMPRAVPAPTDLNRWKNTLSNSTATSTVEFFGKEIRLADADFPSRLLAVFALGVGKGSTLFQVPRESLALSYRQELLLWPTVKGFRTRMIMAFSNPDFVPQQAEEIRSEMLKSVNSWTEADRVRAIGAAEGLFVYGIGVSPFAVTGQTTMGESLERDTFLRAFWFSKSGKDWNPFSYFDTLRLVDLPTLKETANDLLGKSEAKVILGLQGRS